MIDARLIAPPEGLNFYSLNVQPQCGLGLGPASPGTAMVHQVLDLLPPSICILNPQLLG